VSGKKKLEKGEKGDAENYVSARGIKRGEAENEKNGD